MELCIFGGVVEEEVMVGVIVVEEGRVFSKKKVPKFLTCSPKKIPIAHHFYPICFGKCCPLFIYMDGPKGRNSILQNKTFYFREPS